jgi:hypothetical protein
LGGREPAAAGAVERLVGEPRRGRGGSCGCVGSSEEKGKGDEGVGGCVGCGHRGKVIKVGQGGGG